MTDIKPEPTFTVINRIRALKLEVPKATRWAIGAAVRNRYLEEFGELPAKELRSKTNGNGGSHCFAVYPLSFQSQADAIIGTFKVQADAQYELF